MTTITNAATGLRRALAVGVTLATLSVGALVIGVPVASAHLSPLSQRSHGDDDPAGHDSADDDGGTRTGGDDDPAGHDSADDSTDDSGGTRSGGDDDPAGDDSADDNGGTRSGGDGRVIRTGSCSGRADWKLKVKTDDGRLEVEGEIDSNVAGQLWRWTLRHNGSVSDRGTGMTGGRSGSFEVERRIVNLSGTDAVVFRAVRDGQVCRGVVNY